MATRICNILAVDLDPLSSATTLPNRTYTTTRQLRLMDLKGVFIEDQAPAAANFTVTTESGLCITKVVGGVPTERDVFRLGDNASDTRDDATAVAAAGEEIIFASDLAADARITLYCWTLG